MHIGKENRKQAITELNDIINYNKIHSHKRQHGMELNQQTLIIYQNLTTQKEQRRTVTETSNIVKKILE